MLEQNKNETAEMMLPEDEVMTVRSMTFGEKLVGLTFNPSGDPKVNEAKR